MCVHLSLIVFIFYCVSLVFGDHLYSDLVCSLGIRQGPRCLLSILSLLFFLSWYVIVFCHIYVPGLWINQIKSVSWMIMKYSYNFSAEKQKSISGNKIKFNRKVWALWYSLQISLSLPNFEIILPFYNLVRHQQLTLERLKFALHHGKMLTNTCREIQNYTWACFKWPKNVDKMIQTEIHNKITITDLFTLK